MNRSGDDLGRRAAHLHWKPDGTIGLTWNEIAKELKQPRERARSAARNYKRSHPDEFPSTNQEPETKSFQEEGNYAKASSKGTRIRTVPDLLKACQIDLSIWQVRTCGTKAWEGYAANVKKDLRFTAGRSDGRVQRDGIITETLWSVWADFVRIQPVAIHPIVSPIECTVTYHRPPPPSIDGIARSLVFADPHIGFQAEGLQGRLEPFHDRQALDVLLQLATHLQPDRIDILGDWLDLAMWTDKFVRDPAFE